MSPEIDERGVMGQMQPPKPPDFANVDDAIARKVNVNDVSRFLRRIHKRHVEPGEYDQGDVVIISYDTLGSLVAVATIAYGWAKTEREPQ